MSAVLKDLNYYLEHTDEMPTDPKEIEKLANEHMSQALESGQDELTVDKFVPPEDKTEKVVEAKAEPVKTEEAETKTEEPKAEVKTEAKPDGILAKDGKNVIPYSQLETARARTTAAEALVREQAAEIERLKAVEVPGDVETLTEEELTALEADSPTLAKTLRAQQAAIQKLSGQVQDLTERTNGQIANEEAVIKSDIQTAIDANPTLAAWQTAEDQTLWNEASRFDKALRESPTYANVSFADRFKKVVELTQSALGIEPPREEKKESLPTLTPEEIKAAATAKLAKAAKTAVPRSLSDIPGGAPPAVDERQKVEEMSSVALGQQFLGMTKDQIDAYLASL